MNRLVSYGLLLLTAASMACVSRRERRQSVHTREQTALHVQRDTASYRQVQGAHTVQLMETEAWFRCSGWLAGNTGWPNGYTDSTGRFTGCTGRNTVPTGSIYRRTRSITFRSDSNTVSAGRSSRRDSGYTASTKRNTVLSERKTVRSVGYTWWVVAALVVAVLVYRLYRKVFR